MRCINSLKKKMIYLICLSMMILTLCGCGASYELPYDVQSPLSGFRVVPDQNSGTLDSFAADLCVLSEDITKGTDVTFGGDEDAALFDLSNKNVIYAKDAFDTIHPASLTKVMTALVALKYGQLEQTLTAGEEIRIQESGAQLCGLEVGDTMTLGQAIHILLIYSANDVAMMIAGNVGGTVEHFVEMMNQEAAEIGATGTHFENPHGLTEANHYTTVYDLYLIMNAAMDYSIFSEIVQKTSYQTTYYDQNGQEKSFDKMTTNLFHRGDYTPPTNVTVIGGKTGTTNAAGHCLILLVRDINGAAYISVIVKAGSTEELYVEMTDLLEEIKK